MNTQNLFTNIPKDNFPEEIVETLATDGRCRIERILSRGHRSEPDFWYDQEQVEWVCVIEGNAVLEFQNEDGSSSFLEMRRGDHFTINAHQKHRVSSTSHEEPCIWLAVFY